MRDIVRDKSSNPLVVIVMALYNPNRIWFRELLKSVYSQTYDNLGIVIRDDASTDITVEEITEYLEEYDRKIPYVIYRNEVNEGSNKTYEKLIREAEGDYIAFCDQDDVWEEDKIEALVGCLQENNAVMAYSDVKVIDNKGEIVYNSLRELRKRIEYIQGEHLISKYLYVNCTAGCTMMISGDVVEKIGDIPDGSYWDHWTCIVAAYYGRIGYVDRQLMRYRQHGGNQSGVLAGIETKEDYYRIRVQSLKNRADEIQRRNYIYDTLERDKDFINARVHRKLIKIYRYRGLCKKEAWFEIMMCLIPERLFKIIINCIKR